MAMVLLIGPNGLSTRKALTIGQDKMCRPVCKSKKGFSPQKEKVTKDSPSDLFEGNGGSAPLPFKPCLHSLIGPS
jgi:hypothetical protein